MESDLHRKYGLHIQINEKIAIRDVYTCRVRMKKNIFHNSRKLKKGDVCLWNDAFQRCNKVNIYGIWNYHPHYPTSLLLHGNYRNPCCEVYERHLVSANSGSWTKLFKIYYKVANTNEDFPKLWLYEEKNFMKLK